MRLSTAVISALKKTYPEFYEKNRKLNSWDLRHNFVQEYGWSLITQHGFDILSSICKGKRVVDVCAGSGYLASKLGQNCIDITAVDADTGEYHFNTIFRRDMVADATKLDLSPYDVVILSWPPYAESMALDVAHNMLPGQLLIYIGEGSGGCTGDDAFHELLEQSFTHVECDELYYDGVEQFYGLHDRIYLYTKTSMQPLLGYTADGCVSTQEEAYD